MSAELAQRVVKVEQVMFWWQTSQLLTKFLVKNLCDILSFLWAVDRKPGALFDSGLDNSPGSYCPGPGCVWKWNIHKQLITCL